MPEAEPWTEDQIEAGLAELDGWEGRDGRLRKRYTFKTFLRAIAFVNSVAYLSEGAGTTPTSRSTTTRSRSASSRTRWTR